ncbi:putative serine protease 45 [Elephas maximus indicus]|uniref:putative serine protease 45 n=1 Tax=Elephas maximus indicus TaxID=99487 RepID=UPI0021167110|nr:putative serine protease 45 [Elephas maximus indicus]
MAPSQVHGSKDQSRGRLGEGTPSSTWGSVRDSRGSVTCCGCCHVLRVPSRVWDDVTCWSSQICLRSWHLQSLMAASLSRRSAGPSVSRLLVLNCRLLLLLLLLPPLNLGYKEDKTMPGTVVPKVCGKPWWSDVGRHWPWEVSLRVKHEHVCGGALIDPSWVMTAAHCIQGTREYSVMLGTSKLQPVDFTGVLLIPVRDIILHPKYWGRTFIMGDVALLQLHIPATLSEYVQPICLPEPNFHLRVGTQCWVTGWGQIKQRFSANSTLTPELQEAEVFIMDNKRCDRIYHKKSLFPRIIPLVLEDMICATNYGENLCYGDSGGPLACEVEGKWILAGVLSWEKACAKAQNPGVYIRVTKYSKWIKKQLDRALSGPRASTWLLLLSRLLQPQMGP